MSSGRKRSRRDTDSYYYYDGEEEKDGGLERGQGERWTHFGGGDIGDDDSKSSRSSGSLASFAATYEYPLSRYLEPALLEEDGGELRMVLYRINASCVVAPFLEFALASDGDWPHVEEEEEGTTTGSDAGGGEQEEEQEEEEEVRGRLAAATNTAYVLSGAAAENGHFPPRFCGASTFDAAAPDGGRRQYAWFQVDPSVTASASLVWATVHELVRVRAIRGAALAAETASFDPRVWHLLDVRGEPVETPMVLEPLTFIGDDGSGSGSSSARADGEDEADWVQRMMDREADPANYSPRNDAPEHSDHRLVGRTMFSFHDPHWPAFLEAASRGSGKNGNGSGGSTDSTDVERRRRYAVFLEDTLYLVGDCARENAAMLDFADSHGLFGSVYLRCTAASTSDGAANAMGAAVDGAAVDDVAAVDVAAAPATTAFIWLIQSTDQFALLE
jgi:hypothetical protein